MNILSNMQNTTQRSPLTFIVDHRMFWDKKNKVKLIFKALLHQFGAQKNGPAQPKRGTINPSYDFVMVICYIFEFLAPTDLCLRLHFDHSKIEIMETSVKTKHAY